jgi:glucose-1-phosphate thymidylyltransferase
LALELEHLLTLNSEEPERMQMKNRKGIILAGGSGTRLYPITMGISKQLLPVYDKPMIYYPLSVIMLAGIREIAIITTPEDQVQFQRLLGDGNQWGLSFTWITQNKPEGLAQAYLLAESFLDGSPSAMVLGDNIFFGHGLPEILATADARLTGGTVFGYHVKDPERYGVVDFDTNGDVKGIIEKPDIAPSNYAVTGLYFLDGRAPEFASQVQPSSRGELEITELLEHYRADSTLHVEKMGRGFAWLDTGTHASLLDAGNFVRTLTERQGLQVGSPDEIAFQKGWITEKEFRGSFQKFLKNDYGMYLQSILQD